MDIEFTPTARRVGIFSAAATLILLVAYAITLAVGLASLESPQEQIGDPMFSILEVRIIVMMPAVVSLMAAVHAWAPPQAKTLSLISVVFMGMLAGLTCCLHFVVLTLSRQTAFGGQPWLPLFMSFKWPSVVYALDILGWDVFFALSMLFAAPVFRGNRLAASIRALMIASGVLSLAGLSGVVLGDMRFRNIGIVGYVGVFLGVVAMLLILFDKASPITAPAGERTVSRASSVVIRSD